MGEPHIDTSKDTIFWTRPPMRLIAPARLARRPRNMPAYMTWADITAVKWLSVDKSLKDTDCTRRYQDTNYPARRSYGGELTVHYAGAWDAQEGYGDKIYEATYEDRGVEYYWEWEILHDDPNLEITWDRIASVGWRAIYPRHSTSLSCSYAALKDTELTGILHVDYATDKARQMHYWAPGTIRWACYDNWTGPSGGVSRDYRWDWPMDR